LMYKIALTLISLSSPSN